LPYGGLAQNSFNNPLLVARRMIAYCHNNPDGALADGALPAAALDILEKLTRTARSTKLQ
jgi:hypothetical protein